jgi:ribonuclease VapC
VTVLDASAILAFVHDEPGANRVAEALPGASLSAVNLAEVVGKLVDADLDASRLAALLEAAGVTLEPFLAADAQLAGAMRSLAGGRSLSLGPLLPGARGPQRLGRGADRRSCLGRARSPDPRDADPLTSQSRGAQRALH